MSASRLSTLCRLIATAPLGTTHSPRLRNKLRPDPSLHSSLVITLSREEAKRYLVGHHRLTTKFGEGAKGVRKLLETLRCIQLDPLDPIGTNADLVAMARVDGLARGDVYKHLLPGFAFEHFAKERCLLPPSAFPYYRDHAEAQTPWWRLTERLKRLPKGVIEKVLAEIREIGPATTDDLTHHGEVERMDWSGWKGTPRATAMALEVLWTRCDIVVCGRASRNSKIFDVPERALPKVAHQESGDYERWALLERVEAAGLLSRAGNATWSTLSAVRTSSLPDELVEEGALEEVTIEGTSRRYLAPKGFRRRRFSEVDDRVRILGPLDPLIWDRELIKHVFGFDYVWEVYKPAKQRKFGWYVCPLLYHGELIARIEAVIEGKSLIIRKIWREAAHDLPTIALNEALQRHAELCGATKVRMPRKIRVV